MIVRSRTKVKGALLEAGTKLKVVGRAGVGIDNIDVAGAVKMGITVVNSPMAASITVAEHALGLMLAMARSIPQADASIKAGRWEKSAFMGSELYGKQLGIMGLGRIGEQVAHLAAAFGMKVNAYDPFLNSELISQRGASPMSFADFGQLGLSFSAPAADQYNTRSDRHDRNPVYEEGRARGQHFPRRDH